MKSTKYLIQEHKIILRTLDVLDAMSATVAATRNADGRDVDKILDFLRWFGDAHHQAKEETILFPALKSAAAADRPVQHMTLEHSQERAFIEDMEKAVRLEKFSDFVTGAQRLSSALRNHIYKEDHILFELASQALDSSADDTVLEQLNRFETALDKEMLEEKLQELRSLEWKYLRK
jgi:hemerythrin-like domain-containing protein